MCDIHTLPVTAVKGVGEQRANDLARLGIHSVFDLLTYFPYRYEDYRVQDIADAGHGETVTVVGYIRGTPSVRWYGRKKSRLSVKVETHGVWITAIWFNRHYLQQKLYPGKRVVLAGKWDRYRLQLTVRQTLLNEREQEQLVGRLEPVYSVSAPIRVAWLRKVIRQAFLQFGANIVEMLPSELIKRYKLMERHRAMAAMHFPKDRKEGDQARRRLAYEEFFLFQLKLHMWRYVRKKETSGTPKRVPKQAFAKFFTQLPFSLTEAQHRAIREGLRDMEQPSAMYRLLQGDVGAGKTVVAAALLYANYLSGFQGAMMAPTEILAQQHAGTLRRFLEPLGVQVVTLTGSMTAREKRDVVGLLQMGLADVAVGTHALIQETVHFQRLGLVVTDEQHRFGVKQRAKLREKGDAPDVLFMTATPIPRTLAITAFGDMDVSTLDELPKGRKPVKTVWMQPHAFERVIRFVREECTRGRQAYVICPLIEESEKLDLQNAHDVFERVRALVRPFSTGLLHGKLPQKEKDAIMGDFVSGKTRVLVSTTVVEVGVDVPNATVMVIYDAERFGLAQLHQLRGRVGRGVWQSYCVLLSDPKSEAGKERMRVMTKTNDGFLLAQKDLEIRGPGDFFGVKQSGLPEFKVAHIFEDYRMLETARQDAARLISTPSFWESDAYARLRQELEQETVLREKNID